MNLITKEERDRIMAAEDKKYKYLKDKKKNWLSPEEQAMLEKQIGFTVTNEQRARVEVYDFVNDPPDKYTAYINKESMCMTTWTGESLGIVSFGKRFGSNFGDTRQHITVTAINGRTYYGTYYCSAGDYCHVRAEKKSNTKSL